jgi:ceramide glucosyltransferase
VIELLFLAHSAIAAGFACVAAGVAYRRREAPPFALPPLLLLRPTESNDPRLARAAYGGPLEVVVCTAPARDAARNRKVENLAAGLAAARAPRAVVAWADEDVDVAPGDLDALVATLLAEAESGAAIAPPAPAGRGLAPWLASSIFAQSPHAFELLARLARVAGARPRVAGKLVAIRAETLDAIGGFEALAPFIGDDLALTDALATIATSPRPVATRARGTLRELARQLVRWLRVARAHHPLLLLAYPTLLAPLGVALALSAGAPGLALPVLALHLAARTLLAAVLRARLYPGAKGPLVLVPVAVVLGDILLTLALFGAPFRSLKWGEHAYTLARGGRIIARVPC